MGVGWGGSTSAPHPSGGAKQGGITHRLGGAVHPAPGTRWDPSVRRGVGGDRAGAPAPLEGGFCTPTSAAHSVGTLLHSPREHPTTAAHRPPLRSPVAALPGLGGRRLPRPQPPLPHRLPGLPVLLQEGPGGRGQATPLGLRHLDGRHRRARLLVRTGTRCCPPSPRGLRALISSVPLNTAPPRHGHWCWGPAADQPRPGPRPGRAAFPAHPGRERGRVAHPSAEQMAGGSTIRPARSRARPALIVTGTIKRGDVSSPGSALVASQARPGFRQPVAGRSPCQQPRCPPAGLALGGGRDGTWGPAAARPRPARQTKGPVCLGGARRLPASVVRSGETALTRSACPPGSPPGPPAAPASGCPPAGDPGPSCSSPEASNPAATAPLSLFAAVKGQIVANGPVRVGFIGGRSEHRVRRQRAGACLLAAGSDLRPGFACWHPECHGAPAWPR